MIAVDINVVSELMKRRPDQRVVQWASAIRDEEIAVPTLVAAELLRGLDRLAIGARRRGLEGALDAFLTRVGDDNVLSFDARSAAEYGLVMTGRERSGQPMRTMDGLIAATCRAHGTSLATRNTKDFAGVGVDVLNPWAAGS